MLFLLYIDTECERCRSKVVSMDHDNKLWCAGCGAETKDVETETVEDEADSSQTNRIQMDQFQIGRSVLPTISSTDSTQKAVS